MTVKELFTYRQWGREAKADFENLGLIDTSKISALVIDYEFDYTQSYRYLLITF